MTSALVAGAGIGGLATAIALRDSGVDVTLIEQAADLKEVGAALSLWPNALEACRRLRVLDAVLERCDEEIRGGIKNREGRWIAKTEHNVANRYLGGGSVLIRRRDLLRILREAAPEIPIHFATRCVGAGQSGSSAWVELDNGSELRADAVIGCDGIRSAVRPAIGDPGAPRYTGIACWRSITSNPDLVEDSWLTASDGTLFLAAGMAEASVYVSQAVRMKAGQASSIVDQVPFLKTQFSGWHEPIPSLLDLMAKEEVIVDDVYDRPPPSALARGRIALVGDAAHPMTPDLGQGGCQAIEDAVVPGMGFAVEPTVEGALKHYEERRLRRVRMIVGNSAQICRLTITKNPAVNFLRDPLLRVWPRHLQMSYLARFASKNSFVSSLS